MSRRPATVMQADIARAIRAAKQAGATEIAVHIGGAIIRVSFAPSTPTEKPIEDTREIVL